jgi:protein-disulfide isomerase
MRGMAVVCLVTMGCAAGAEMRPRGRRNAVRIDALEKRVAALEAHGAPPAAAQVEAGSPHLLEDKIAKLQLKIEALQAQLDRPAAATPPVIPPSRPMRPGLDENRAYPVPLDDSPASGAATAPVTIVAALQFPEPYTHRVFPTLVQLRATYKKQLRIVVKTFVVHPRATASSIAACAAGYQDRLAKIEDAIYTAATDQGSMREVGDAEAREIARSLHLDLKQYDQDVVTCTAALTRDAAMFKNLGQNGVPGFWINGRPLSGAQPLESFKRVIDEELVKAKSDQASGGKPADYYERVTREKPNPF